MRGVAVGVYLHRSWHTDRLCLHVVTEHGHISRGLIGVVCDELKIHLLILPYLDCRGQVVAREDTPVSVAQQRTDERLVTSGFQDVKVDTFGLDCKVVRGIHFRNHLDCMPPGCKGTQREVKVAVGDAGLGYGLCVLLLAVHIEGHDLCSCTRNGERY